jgi:hypothetical protein
LFAGSAPPVKTVHTRRADDDAYRHVDGAALLRELAEFMKKSP